MVWITLILVLQIIILIRQVKLEGYMDELNAVLVRVQASATKILDRVNALKASQVDPAVLATAVASFSAVADSLDAGAA